MKRCFRHICHSFYHVFAVFSPPKTIASATFSPCFRQFAKIHERVCGVQRLSHKNEVLMKGVPLSLLFGEYIYIYYLLLSFLVAKTRRKHGETWRKHDTDQAYCYRKGVAK